MIAIGSRGLGSIQWERNSSCTVLLLASKLAVCRKQQQQQQQQPVDADMCAMCSVGAA
jgi:hypothetical protein